MNTQTQNRKHIVIYGGNGFVGSNIAKQFAEKGHSVTCVSRQGKKPVHLDRNNPDWANKVTWLKGDAADPDPNLLAGADIVVTTVGSPPTPTFTKAGFENQYHLNGRANIRLMEAVAACNIGSLVIISAQIPSFLQLDRFAYARGKLDVIDKAHEYFTESKTAVTILQPSVIYGLRHTKTGRRVNLGFMSYFSNALQFIARKVKFAFFARMGAIAPVDVEHIAGFCANLCENAGVHEGVRIVANNELLEVGVQA